LLVCGTKNQEGKAQMAGYEWRRRSVTRRQKKLDSLLA